MGCFRRDYNLSCDHGNGKESQKQNAEKLSHGHCTAENGRNGVCRERERKRKNRVKSVGKGFKRPKWFGAFGLIQMQRFVSAINRRCLVFNSEKDAYWIILYYLIINRIV